MSGETDLITPDKRPLSGAVIAQNLRDMGLASGDLVLMHVALSKLGWVIGGVRGLLGAVLDVLGPGGTLVMPGFSSQLSDPKHWSSPAIPQSWIDEVRKQMPLFDADLTPVRGIGAVAEAFRALPKTSRSAHPCDSFLAHGPLANDILADHSLGNSLGKASPLGQLYQRDAKVLLLGAGFDTCTSFHLAEQGVPGFASEQVEYPTARKNGVTEWESVNQPACFEKHFAALGADFEEHSCAIQFGFDKSARLFSMRQGVDFARIWLKNAAESGRLQA